MTLDKAVLLNRLNDKKSINANNCWLWLGSQSRDHGVISVDSKNMYVHRLSMFIFNNFDLNSKFDVLHKRECLSPMCFNPDHLYIGTDSDNHADYINNKGESFIPFGIASGYNREKTHCVRGHEFIEGSFTLDKSDQGYVKRRCKKCQSIRYKQYYQKKKGN